MSDHSSELVLRLAAEAAVEQYKAGGIIEGTLSNPEQSMEGAIQKHLANVAVLSARGDTAPERPTYVLNPDNGLLINYAYRRNDDSRREGFFADVVQLDDTGKPRHGVNVINPFATKTGFINVAVGENEKGFAPSSVNLKFESEDPASLIPPNIAMADLMAMLSTEPISPETSLDEFLQHRQTTQAETRGRVQSRNRAMYLPNYQSIDKDTDASLHLIVTDREDTSALESVSRQVGIFPIVISAREMAIASIKLREDLDKHMDDHVDQDIKEFMLNSFTGYVEVGPHRRQIIKAFENQKIPAFVTADFEYSPLTNEEAKRREVNGRNVAKMVSHILGLDSTSDGLLNKNPVFSTLANHCYEYDEIDPVTKLAHGQYEFPIDPSNPTSVEKYTDWLRKARLDFMLTLYLRGLSSL